MREALDAPAGIEELEDRLSEPTPAVVEALGRLPGDILVLGAGGKIGPSLARMARRASEAAGVRRRVIAVSRFGSEEHARRLREAGVEVMSKDLLRREELASLPDVPNVIFMAGMKFGSTGQEALTWGMNCVLPAMVCERFRAGRLLAFSTGNVYGLTPLAAGGSVETDPPNAAGEYAQSCLGRERVVEFFSRSTGMPATVLRLNYAVEMRYGVLSDIARRVLSGEPVDLSMGAVNVIWQGDANAMTLLAFERTASPPFILNIAGPEQLSVRRVALELAALMGKEARFSGAEADSALLSNGQLGHSLFGYPRVSAATVLRWTARWVLGGGPSLGKPTHFEARDGRF